MDKSSKVTMTVLIVFILIFGIITLNFLIAEEQKYNDLKKHNYTVETTETNILDNISNNSLYDDNICREPINNSEALDFLFNIS